MLTTQIQQLVYLLRIITGNLKFMLLPSKMKTTFLLAAAAATLAGTVSAAGEYICETSDASPYLHNVDELVDNLNNEEVGVNLCNPGPENGCGKTNTGYSGSGGAAFMICGPDMRVRYVKIHIFKISLSKVLKTVLRK